MPRPFTRALSIQVTSATTSFRSTTSAARRCCPRSEMIVEQMKRVPGRGRGRPAPISALPPTTTSTMALSRRALLKRSTSAIISVDEGFFDAMGLTLKAGRWFDPNRPMDDQTVPYPIGSGCRKGDCRARRQRRDQRTRREEARLWLGPECDRQGVSRRDHRRDGVNDRHPRHRGGRRQPVPLGSRSDRSR